MDLWTQLLEEFESTDYKQAVLIEIGKTDPKLALELAQTGAAAGVPGAVVAALKGWARTSALDAFNWTWENFQGKGFGLAMAAVVKEAAMGTSRVELAARLLELKPASSSQTGSKALAGGLLARDWLKSGAPGVVKWIDSIPAGDPMRAVALSGLVSELALDDPEAAGSWVLNNVQPGSERKALLASVTAGWMGKGDLIKAERWIDFISDTGDSSSSVIKFIQAQARVGPLDALRRAEQLQTPEDAYSAALMIEANVPVQSPMAGFKMFEDARPGTVRNALLRSYAALWNKTDSAAMTAYVSQSSKLTDKEKEFILSRP